MNTVTETITTQIERELLVSFLERFNRSIYVASTNIRELVLQIPNPILAKSLLTYFGEDIEYKDKDELLIKSNELKKHLLQIRQVELVIPHAPTDDLVVFLKKWLRDTGIAALVHFKTDEKMIGGAVVESKGFVTEYSFRQYFEKRKTERKGEYGL